VNVSVIDDRYPVTLFERLSALGERASVAAVNPLT
jgi:hypothetical protein